MYNEKSCASPTILKFCQWFRDGIKNDGLVMIHLQTKDLLHPGYLIRKGEDEKHPLELELLESLVTGKNGNFASRDRIQEVLSNRYPQFDLEMFEQCIEEVIRIEQGLKNGSIAVTRPPSDADFSTERKPYSRWITQKNWPNE